LEPGAGWALRDRRNAVRRWFGAFLIVGLGVVLITTGLPRNGAVVGTAQPTCGDTGGGVEPPCPEGTINITEADASPKGPPTQQATWSVDITTANCVLPQGGTSETVTVPNKGTGSSTPLYVFDALNFTDPCVYTLVEEPVADWSPSFNPPSPVSISWDNFPTGSHEDVTVTNTSTKKPPPKPRPNTSLVKTTINQRRHTVRFAFRASQHGATFHCALAKSGRKRTYHKCTSPKTYRKLTKGRYLFTVRASGKGGTDKTPARKRFRIRPASHHNR
jgi:hypothetical protein